MFSDAIAALNRWFVHEGEEGQALAEYALILGLIAIVAVAALTLMGIAISGELDGLAGAFGGGGS